MNLTAALKAIRHGDLDAALDRLLTLWRVVPAARLADAIDAVDRAVTAAPTAAWRPITAAPARSPVEVTERLRALTRDASAPELTERVASLTFLPQDPRVATRLIALLRAPPFTASSHKALWRAVFTQLRGTHSDPRSEAALRALAPDYPRIAGDTAMGRWMASEIVKTHFTVEARYPRQHPAHAPLAASDEAALGDITDAAALR